MKKSECAVGHTAMEEKTKRLIRIVNMRRGGVRSFFTDITHFLERDESSSPSSSIEYWAEVPFMSVAFEVYVFLVVLVYCRCRVSPTTIPRASFSRSEPERHSRFSMSKNDGDAKEKYGTENRSGSTFSRPAHDRNSRIVCLSCILEFPAHSTLPTYRYIVHKYT